MKISRVSAGVSFVALLAVLALAGRQYAARVLTKPEPVVNEQHSEGKLVQKKKGIEKERIAEVEKKFDENKARFRVAYRLIHLPQPDYKEALHLIEVNIRNAPHDREIDYSYGWGFVAATELKRYDQAMGYLEVLQTQFKGRIMDDFGGPIRTWKPIIERTLPKIPESYRSKRLDLTAGLEVKAK